MAKVETFDKPINHKERAHALLSASGASRWMNCTPSAVLEDQNKEIETSYALEGTLAHELAELELRHFFKPPTFSAMQNKKLYKEEFEKIKKSEYFSAEMIGEVEKYTDFVKEEFAAILATDKNAVIFLERKLDLSAAIPEGFATGDTTIIGGGVCHVIDLKYGKGVKVSAYENPQLKLYGFGGLEEFGFAYDIDEIKVSVCQPRLDEISTFAMPTEDLLKWIEEEVKPKALTAFEGGGELNPGEWCKFCDVKARCKALAKKATEIAKHDFKDPALLTEAEVLEAYKNNDILVDWSKAVSNYVFTKALAGKKWPGFKLVEGKSNRVIADGGPLRKALKDAGLKDEDYLKNSLKGIGDLTKALGKIRFEEIVGPHVSKPTGPPTLVEATDKRPELGTDSAKHDFADDPL